MKKNWDTLSCREITCKLYTITNIIPLSIQVSSTKTHTINTHIIILHNIQRVKSPLNWNSKITIQTLNRHQKMIQMSKKQVKKKRQTFSLGMFLHVFSGVLFSLYFWVLLTWCGYLYRLLYDAQTQVLRHDEGGGCPGCDAVWYSQSHLCCVWITAGGKKQIRNMIIFNLPVVLG